MIQNRRNWSDYEDKAIITLVKKYGTKNWAQISEKMSSKYGIENRTGKQCRQRWHNHLDPDVNKEAWTSKQQKIMFDAHQRYGNKWTEIAKLFDGRTDNDIKNHFYSMLRRSLRRVNKILGMRNSTKKIRVIKPSVLSKIFSNNGIQNEQKIQERRLIAQALFEFSKSKSPLDLNSIIDSAEKKKLEELIQKLAIYNEQYQANQLLKKDSKKSKDQNSQADLLQSIQINKIQLENSNGFAIKKKSRQQGKNDERILKTKKVLSQVKIQQQEKASQGLMNLFHNITQNRKETAHISNQKKGSKKIINNSTHKTQKSTAISHQKNISHQSNQQEELKPISGITTRLQKKSSFSLNFQPESFNFPEIFELPDVPSMQRISSSYNEQKRQGFNHFLLNSTPKIDTRLFTRTPKQPTPNMFLSRNIQGYEWTANNDELNMILNQTRQTINRKTK